MESELGDLSETVKPVVLTPMGLPSRQGFRVQHLMYAIGICALVAWMTIIAGLWFLTGSIFLLVAGAIGLAMVVVRRGVMQQESLLWALAIASERSMPLAPAALAFSDQFSGSYRIKVQIFAHELEKGTPFPLALNLVGGLLNAESELLARVGWATGTLSKALRLAASAKASRQAAWAGLAGRFAYFAFVIFNIQVVSGIIVYLIAPKFRAIFADFGIALPRVTVLTLQATDFLSRYFYLSFPLLVIQVVAFALVPLALLGLFHMNVPLVDYLFRRRHSALILRSLSLTTEGGRPIGEGLEILAADYPSSWVRKRLVLVRQDVERGIDWVDSLGDHGLLRPADEAVLSSSQRASNLPWALREMAEANERRLGYRLQLLSQILFPIMILALGLAVLVFAVAYFSPVVKLIEVLAR